VNGGLTRGQIEDILTAAEDVDVSATQMLSAAEEIRAALLGPATDSSRHSSEVVALIRVPRQTRRARTRVAAVCAATLSVAVLVGAANAGALPTVVQRPVSRAAGLIGIDLPEPDSSNVPETGPVHVAHDSDSSGASNSTASMARDTGETAPTPGTSSDPNQFANPPSSTKGTPTNNSGAANDNNAGGETDSNVGTAGSNAAGNGTARDNGGKPDNKSGGDPENHAGVNAQHHGDGKPETPGDAPPVPIGLDPPRSS